MEIQVRPLTSFEGSHWEVRMGRNKVSFRSEAEARDFAKKLQARVAAPHQLPEQEKRRA